MVIGEDTRVRCMLLISSWSTILTFQDLNELVTLNYGLRLGLPVNGGTTPRQLTHLFRPITRFPSLMAPAAGEWHGLIEPSLPRPGSLSRLRRHARFLAVASSASAAGSGSYHRSGSHTDSHTHTHKPTQTPDT